MTDYEKDSTELLSKCIDIIEAETKPLKRKPGDRAMACRKVRIKRDRMESARLSLACDTSELMDIGKEFD